MEDVVTHDRHAPRRFNAVVVAIAVTAPAIAAVEGARFGGNLVFGDAVTGRGAVVRFTGLGPGYCQHVGRAGHELGRPEAAGPAGNGSAGAGLRI